MCRALSVMCVAEDDESLRALKRAAVSAEWELSAGETDGSGALERIRTERPHVLVVFGEFDDLIATVRDRMPTIRIVSDRDAPGVTVVATSLEEVRGLVLGLPRPGGPVGGA